MTDDRKAARSTHARALRALLLTAILVGPLAPSLLTFGSPSNASAEPIKKASDGWKHGNREIEVVPGNARGPGPVVPPDTDPEDGEELEGWGRLLDETLQPVSRRVHRVLVWIRG